MFSLLQSQRGKSLQLVLKHKNTTDLDYAVSWVVNHSEDFQCPANKFISHDISGVLCLYMHQKRTSLLYICSLPQQLFNYIFDATTICCSAFLRLQFYKLYILQFFRARLLYPVLFAPNEKIIYKQHSHISQHFFTVKRFI